MYLSSLPYVTHALPTYILKCMFCCTHAIRIDKHMLMIKAWHLFLTLYLSVLCYSSDTFSCCNIFKIFEHQKL
jgi:hypothetical protein